MCLNKIFKEKKIYNLFPPCILEFNVFFFFYVTRRLWRRTKHIYNGIETSPNRRVLKVRGKAQKEKLK